jgi:ATP-dependent Lon protease
VLGIIRHYTKEAGLRGLEREIGTTCRKVARQIAEGRKQVTVVTPDKLHDYLGPRKFRYEIAEQADEVGVATGLAWTPAGGDVIFVEATLVPGKGNLILTGKLGDVMQESAKAAFTYVRSVVTRPELRKYVLNIPDDFYEKSDVHIHVPAGAIPKDGPSAGVTMAVALASAVTKHLVSKDIAMTGEITLRGKVLPVGGIRDKVLAAHRGGLRRVILPKENERDLEEIPQEVKEELQFIFVDNMDEALEAALKDQKA